MKYLKTFESQTKEKFVFNKKLYYIAKKLTNNFGYNMLRYLSKGSFGYAFLLNDKKVLKITSDPNEIKYVKEHLNIDSDCLVKYYKILKIPRSLISSTSYAILMEYVIPINDELKSLYTRLFIKFKYFSEILEGVMNDEMKKELYDFIENDDIKNKEESKHFIKKFIEFGIKLSKENLRDPFEAHTDNIGWRDGNLIYFDIKG